MSSDLHELRVLALDCQAAGATPAHGDLLELGWAISGSAGIEGTIASHWVLPRSERRVPRAVRELTGWDESCLAEARPELVLWSELLDAVEQLPERPAPCVVHFARFELAFLRDLHARLTPELPFPLEVACVHEIALRLFPTLPRRNLRALAGHLGHSAELTRRAHGHVAATAHIWRALLPELAARGVHDWRALIDWLGTAPRPARPKKRTYPLPPALRRALPSRPGVYRFVRKNGDVLYVGKAANLKARVASHFAGHARATERALEMLTQVADIDYSETSSVLEAALLECDEIKRIDPPYNIHLRAQDRATWYASRDLREVATAPDAAHRQGPLPSRFAAAPLAALAELVVNQDAAPRWRALALGVPNAFLPEEALFRAGFAQFCADYLVGAGTPARQLARAARELWLTRGRSEEPGPEDAPPDSWDLARVRRRLERNLIQAGLTLRRARWLRLLAEADVAYRETGMEGARVLQVREGVVTQRESHATLDAWLAQVSAATRPLAPGALDIATYDRLRVLATELRRVLDEGGEVAVRLGRHVLTGARLLRLTRAL